MNVSGEKSIVSILRGNKMGDGHNQALKEWDRYWDLKADEGKNLAAILETIGMLRNQFNHKQHEITRESAQDGINAMIAVQTMLDLPTGRLEEVGERLAKANGLMTVSADTSDAMHIPFKDSREYLVARDDLIKGVADRFKDVVADAGHIEVLHGESGAGKTVAAIAVAYALFNDLPVQIFMQGSSVAQLRTELARYAQLHISGVDENEKDDELVDKARKHLAERTGWLLLVDDVGPDLQGVLDLLPVNEDDALVGRVLLTSQGRSAWPTKWPETKVHATEVNELGTEQAMKFLSQGKDKEGKDKVRVHRDVHQDVLDNRDINLRGFIETVLGSLALDVALLKNALGGIDLAKAKTIVDGWRDMTAESLESAKDMSESQCRSLRGRMGTVRELMRRLEASCEDDVWQAARSLLAMCSVLDPAGVPSVLFTDGATALSELSPGACLFRDSKLYARAALKLVDVGLVHDDSGRGLTMHQLVQTCVRHELRRGEVVGLREWGPLYTVLKERYVDVINSNASRKPATALHTCALAIYRRCEGVMDTKIPLLAPLKQAELGDAIGSWFYHASGMSNWNEALPLYKRALAIRVEQLGLEHPDTATSLNNLLLDKATSLNNLGLLHKAMGNFGEAEPRLVGALAIREALDSDTGGSLNDLAGLQMAMGNNEEALRLYEQLLKINGSDLAKVLDNLRKILLDTATSLNNLGLLHKAMGHNGEAKPRLVGALAICEAQLGPEHPGMGGSLNSLAGLHTAMGNNEEALRLYKQALKISEKRHGSDHLATAIVLDNLGSLHTTMGNHAEARPLHERALKIYDKGPDSLDKAVCLNKLGGCLRKLGRFAEALSLHKRALGIYEEQLDDPHHVDMAISLNHLGKLHEAMGDRAKELGSLQEATREYEAALQRLERALKILEKSLGPNHFQTATNLFNIVRLHKAMGDHAKALSRLRLLLDPSMQLPVGMFEEVHGMDQVLRRLLKVGPNDRCSCGSRAKYKKCCGRGGWVTSSRGGVPGRGRGNY
jgi:tetratricopeptide (TPR) repeat protein